MSFFNHQNFPEQFLPDDQEWSQEIETLLDKNIDTYQFLDYIINKLMSSNKQEYRNFVYYLTGMDLPDKNFLNIHWNKYMKLHEIIIEIEKTDIDQHYTRRIYDL